MPNITNISNPEIPAEAGVITPDLSQLEDLQKKMSIASTGTDVMTNNLIMILINSIKELKTQSEEQFKVLRDEIKEVKAAMQEHPDNLKHVKRKQTNAHPAKEKRASIAVNLNSIEN